MENVTIQLQEFLDGSLTHEAEAELLHRLSVSPERRDILRSYMKQQAIISSDRAAISVPYAAEQKLWAALATMPPAFEPIVASIPSAVTTSSTVVTGFTAFRTAMVASLALIIGLVSGYVIWHTTEPVQVAAPIQKTIESVPASTIAAVTTTDRPIRNNSIQNNTMPATSRTSNKMVVHASAPVRTTDESFEAPLPQLDMTSTQMPEDLSIASKQSNPSIPQAAYFLPASVQIREPGMQNARTNINVAEPTESHRSSFLERFDFSIQESIGKQFPNNDATNTSMPIITNSNVSVKYMLTPSFWIGASVGSSNVTQKVLAWSVKDYNATSLIYEATADLKHMQTTWYGGLLEYRMPISSKVAFAANLGAAATSLGPIYYSSELGLRFDVTGDVGVNTALRVTAIQSGVQAQYKALTNNRPQNAGRSDAVSLNDPFNTNYELSTGIYFHF
ncbi:MAG TPA: hypothetical protein VFO76_02005 [Candidatus Kapabacteria bacterium]|nr:hypothetical protein [Candidatus Kapabacteria bacterium]